MTDELPPGWVLTTLGEIVDPPRSKASPVSYPDLPFVGMDQIAPNGMELLGTYKFGDMKSNGGLFFDGDVLYGRMRPYLNKVHRAEFDGACSAEFIVMPASDAVDGDFLAYLLHHQRFVNFASSQSSGDRPRVDFGEISGYGFGLPPRNEQLRIVSKIDELFSRIDEGEQALKRVGKLVERYRQSVLKAAVTGELTRDWREAKKRAGEPVESGAALLAHILKARRAAWEAAELTKLKAKGKPPTDERWKQKYQEPTPPDTTDLPELPEGWVWAGIEQFLNPLDVGMKTGPFGTLLSKSEHVPTGVPVIGIENIGPRGGFIAGTKVHITATKADALAGYDVVPGDVVISRSGTVGELCVIPTNIGPARFSTNIMRIRLAGGFNAKFFCYLFLGSPLVLGQVRTLCKGSTRDFLNQHILRSLVFPVPPTCEQTAIVDAVEKQMSHADGLISQVRASTTAENALRQSILKAAFSGQLVPQDPNDEPASKLLERIAAERASTADRPQRKTKRSSVNRG